ncbi:MAG: FkbM family methyltransferase [Gemmatimonadaceae bacterium]|jgi:FkbM family methyltransferase|nr:FkbM family methyltransferase [Gemmatimonadaceae bacterium]
MLLIHDLAALLPQLTDADVPRFCAWYDRYAPQLATIDAHCYGRLPEADRPRFLAWFLKRWAKIDLVNPVERGLYASTIARVKTEPREPVTVEGRPYLLRDFSSQGHPFALAGYDWFLGVHDIQYDQYQHGDVTLTSGDVIIDAGAFIGDTAVFFHHLLGGRCQIHSFELLDENLALLVHNLVRNGVRDEQVVLNQLALTNRSGDEIVVHPGASQGSTNIFGRTDGHRVQTITLDDYVVAQGLERVDFIKMDIEGAEVMALEGARQTIRHFRPRLAICLYHKWDDVVTIPRAIEATGVPYTYRFKWVQLSDGWEAVLLASPLDAAAVPVERSPAEQRVGQAMIDALGVLARGVLRASPTAGATPRTATTPLPKPAAAEVSAA